MSEILSNKLVRDKVVNHLISLDLTPKYHTIEDDQQLLDAAKGKLIEKANEVDQEDTAEAILEELADIQEVIYITLEAIGKSKAELRDARAKKYIDKGGFSDKIFLESVMEKD